MDRHIVLGPPGTGKTTHLLNLLEEDLKTNDPDKIGFFSFTRKGAYEAKERATDRFGFKDRDLPYFRTLHSLAFFELGMTSKKILKRKHYKELSKILGVELMHFGGIGEVPTNRFLFLDHFARNKMIDLREAWYKYGEEEPWHHLKQVIESIDIYKKEKGLFDFTDLVENFTQERREIPLDIVYIDEGQDLTALQWHMVESAFPNAKKIIIAGDDDQSIYKWAGADVDYFLNLKGKTTHLKQSWRIPRRVHKLSNRVVKKIVQRIDKPFAPRDEEGGVFWHNDLDEIELNQESWLLLARSNYMLKRYEEFVRRQGFVYRIYRQTSIDQDYLKAIYAWENYRKGGPRPRGENISLWLSSKATKEDPWFKAFVGMPLYEKEYYRACLRRGGNLRSPNVSIATIHRVKGGQADNVILMMDMSWKTYQAYQREPDDENRVFYVGITRTRKNLHLVASESGMSFTP